jgi:transposase InsO family protein
MPPTIREALLAQYWAHPSWSYQLHHDNLAALVAAEPERGALPSYATVRRFMKSQGLVRRRRKDTRLRPGERRAAARREQREVRSYEATHVHGLWHADFHHGSLPVLRRDGQWQKPVCLGVLDDRSRLACHVQWYLAESAETFVHGLCQALQKRGLPRALLTDNGKQMTAAEVRQGLHRLSVVHDTTLPYSPYQNGKQESFWSQLEGRLLAMLEGQRELTLARLNEVTQAWVEFEYHQRVHSECGATPLRRWREGPDLSRDCPDSDALRLAFCAEQSRAQRRSDGTITLHGQRFEVPSRFRHLTRVAVRFARWDLSRVHLVDERTGKVLDRLYPLDKQRNADGLRRRLPSPETTPAEPPVAPDLPPLLQQLLDRHGRTGLPSAYLPLDHDDPETPS